jgi:hypothetical protein
MSLKSNICLNINQKKNNYYHIEMSCAYCGNITKIGLNLEKDCFCSVACLASHLIRDANVDNQIITQMFWNLSEDNLFNIILPPPEYLQAYEMYSEVS